MDGLVYAWGFGVDGQLGLGNISMATGPKRLRHEHWQEGISYIACGEAFSAVITGRIDIKLCLNKLTARSLSPLGGAVVRTPGSGVLSLRRGNIKMNITQSFSNHSVIGNR